MKRMFLVAVALFVLVMAPLIVKFAVSTRTSAHADNCGIDAVVVDSTDSNQIQFFCNPGDYSVNITNVDTVVSSSWSGYVVANDGWGPHYFCPGDTMDLSFSLPTVTQVHLDSSVTSCGNTSGS